MNNEKFQECYIVSEPNGKSLGKFLDKVKNDEEYKEIVLSEEEAAEINRKLCRSKCG